MQEKDKLLIAIGDLHGNFDALVALLDSLHSKYSIFKDQSMLELDEKAHLVFTGDYIDRGNNALQVITRLDTLEKFNPKNIHVLLGNHELMALAYLDEAKRLQQELEGDPGLPALTAYRGNLHGANGGISFLREFGEEEKDMFSSYAKRMSRSGDIGAWIRKLHPRYETEAFGKKILFVHADIPDSIQSRESIDEYIDSFYNHIRTDTKLLGGAEAKYLDLNHIMHRGLFWERTFEHYSEENINEMLSAMKVDYIVTGHTPHRGIQSYSGKIFDIDVGMGIWKGMGVPEALVIKSTGVYSFLARGEEKMLAGFSDQNKEEKEEIKTG